MAILFKSIGLRAAAISARMRRRRGDSDAAGAGPKRSLLRCRRGSTAVEFAIVIMPFMMTMYSTFEVGWFYFTNSVIDAASVSAARMVRTGEAQNGGLDKQAFFDEICPKVAPLGDCDLRMTLEVRTFATFAALAADTSPPVCRDSLPAAIAAIPYQPGVISSIVRVRICFLYNTLNPAIGVNMSESDNGRRRLISTHLFRNEPF